MAHFLTDKRAANQPQKQTGAYRETQKEGGGETKGRGANIDKK